MTTAPLSWIKLPGPRPLLLLLLLFLFGCEPSNASQTSTNDKQGTPPARAASVTLAAYTTPREVYGKSILPAFQAQWRTRPGEEVTFNESYAGSGAQARAVLAGFNADVVALSLEPDVALLSKAGLITHDWKARPFGGMVTRSAVVIGVRPGNPQKIRGWKDLARPGIQVLTPNVRTSGGAMWNILAIYGAALRGQVDGILAGDQKEATRLLGAILRNVKIMDRGARESLLNFERGVGDAIITYENEILLGQKAGKKYDYITPSSTILIENPVALVDQNVERHGSRAVSQAFLDFLLSEQAQSAFAEYGLRPVDPAVAQKVKEQFSRVEDLFTVLDLDGWDAIQRTVFSSGGVYDSAIAHSRRKAP